MALAKSQQSLKKWTAQKWKTSDGKPSKGKKRYLPAAALRRAATLAEVLEFFPVTASAASEKPPKRGFAF